MPFFRKQPVVIEAVHFTEENEHEVLNFIGKHGRILFVDKQPKVIIHTLEGDHRGDLGCWIIKGVAGEFYPCAAAIFEATYEPVDGPAPVDLDPEGADHGEVDEDEET